LKDEFGLVLVSCLYGWLSPIFRADYVWVWVVTGWVDWVPHNISLSTSFWGAVSFSGNWMSKATRRSPLRVVSLGNGSPYPWIRFTVFGLIISCMVLMRNLSPDMVGTWKTTPHRAWKLQENIKILLFIYLGPLMFNINRSNKIV